MPLTPQHREILHALSRGDDVPTVAEKRGIQPESVYQALSRLRRLAGVKTTWQLILWWRDLAERESCVEEAACEEEIDLVAIVDAKRRRERDIIRGDRDKLLLICLEYEDRIARLELAAFGTAPAPDPRLTALADARADEARGLRLAKA